MNNKSLLDKYDSEDPKVIKAKALMAKIDSVVNVNRLASVLLKSNQIITGGKVISILGGKMMPFPSDFSEAPMDLNTLLVKNIVINYMLAYDDDFLETIIKDLDNYDGIENLTEEDDEDIIDDVMEYLHGPYAKTSEMNNAKINFIEDAMQNPSLRFLIKDIFEITKVSDFDERIRKFEARKALNETTMNILKGETS